jgi:uncharacterized protein YbbK (DUF523 family)
MSARPRPLRIGISRCLLGDEVRFYGGHKRDSFLSDVLGPRVEWVRVCPEVEVGMGVPRETLHLVRAGGSVRLITTHTKIDHTGPMRRWAARRVRALAGERLSGYVLKRDSPSCGMARVKVYDEAGGAPEPVGVGLFAAELLRAFPTLPVEDEGRLSDPVLRESFIERVFAYYRGHHV